MQENQDLFYFSGMILHDYRNRLAYIFCKGLVYFGNNIKDSFNVPGQPTVQGMYLIHNIAVFFAHIKYLKTVCPQMMFGNPSMLDYSTFYGGRGQDLLPKILLHVCKITAHIWTEITNIMLKWGNLSYSPSSTPLPWYVYGSKSSRNQNECQHHIQCANFVLWFNHANYAE